MGYQKLYIFFGVGNKTASKFIPNYFLLDNRDISGQVRVTFSIRCPCGAPTSKSFSFFFSTYFLKNYRKNVYSRK